MLKTGARAFTPIYRRGIALEARSIATLPLYRQTDRVPPGRVRPRRVIQPTSHNPQPFTAQEGTYDAFPGSSSGLNDSPVAASTPVVIPPDPSGVLSHSHSAHELLANDALVIVRQLEMLNVFIGYEQANKYAIYNTQGDLVGYMAETESGILSTISRQTLRTHRPFRSIIMDKHGNPVLWIRRPFQFINSRIYVHAGDGEDGRLVGEAQQEWHPWRRRYNVFQSAKEDNFKQFARIDSGFLAWDFWLKDGDDRLIASINRNFSGFGRELFTDTGQYVIRFDSAGQELALPPGSTEASVQGQTLVLPDSPGLTMDQRAMTLATAVSVDFDYFSRHSGSGGMGLPFFMWGGGDGSSDVNTGRGEAGAAGEVGGAAGMGAGAGAGAAGAMGQGMSEDEYIYGRQPDQPAAPGQDPNQGGDYPMDGELFEDQWGEEVMQDPWGEEAGGGDGDWGDFGDSF